MRSTIRFCFAKKYETLDAAVARLVENTGRLLAAHR
jgi:hypothetical protein